MFVVASEIGGPCLFRKHRLGAYHPFKFSYFHSGASRYAAVVEQLVMVGPFLVELSTVLVL